MVSQEALSSIQASYNSQNYEFQGRIILFRTGGYCVLMANGAGKQIRGGYTRPYPESQEAGIEQILRTDEEAVAVACDSPCALKVLKSLGTRSDDMFLFEDKELYWL